jgi:putative glutamine amidotransferase
MDVGGDRFYLRKQYSEAIVHAGGSPLLIPLIPDKAFADELTTHLDGIVLSGSNSDVDPNRYKQEPHPKIGSVLTRRDQTDWLLLEGVFKKKKPLLAICFGIQILNVYLGGTLWQDLPSQVKDAVKHDQTSSEDYHSHSLRIKPGSLLDSLAGVQKIKVNSYHHQAIRELSPKLISVASSPDGIVEAVELRIGRQFLLGVQWHPEIGWETDDLSQKIFRCFVDDAKDSVQGRKRNA